MRKLVVLLLLLVPALCLAEDISLLRVDDIHKKTLNQDQLKVLERANEDIRLVIKGQEPKHAKLHTAASDGGTVWYKNNDYEICSWKALGTLIGRHGFTCGVSIEFDRGHYSGNMGTFSYTWFKPDDVRP